MPGRTGPARRAWIGLVQSPKSAYLLAPGFQNGFGGGTNTTVISTANSGGASGDAFSTVTGSPTFSSTQALHGALSAQFALVTSTVTSLTTTKPGTTTEHWAELFVYFTALPPAITTLYSAVSTATVAASVKLDTAGKILVAPTSGTTDYTFTAALTLNAWNRIELHLVNSTVTGTMQTILYAADSTTAVEDSGVRSTTSTLANTTSHVFGQNTAVAGTTSTWWLDDPEIGTTGFIGPQPNPAVPVLPSRVAPVGPTLRGTFTPATTAVITTGSFTPTAGSLLIATTYGDAVAGIGNSATVTDTLGNRWDPAYLRNFAEDGRNGYLQAWYQVVEASPVARTVTVTDADGTQAHGGWVEEWTSVDTTVVPFGVEEFRGSNSADPLTVVLTTVYPNSQVIGAGSNWDTSNWVAGAATTVNQTSQVAVSAGGASLKATAVTPVAGTTVTLTASRAGTVADFHLVAFELVGALGTVLATNTAEGGTSGTAATPANTGGASGTAFTRVVLGTSGVISFDAAWSSHGSLSYNIVPTAGGGSAAYLGQDLASVPSSLAVRVYALLDTLPSAATQLIQLRAGLDAGSTVGNLFVNTNGSWGIQNLGGVTVFTASAGTLVAATAYRFEYYWLLGASTGEARAAVYAGDSLTALSDSGLLTGQANGTSTVGSWRVGKGTATGTWTLHVDDLAWVQGGTGFIGPVVTAPSVKQPLMVSQYAAFF